jgi:RNA polymerase sigma factor (sigma-70 family)
MIIRYETALKRTARRYSLDDADAEDAYQRALEIVLTKAPSTDLRELIRWTQTVTKHEALAVRRSREKLLGYQARRGRDGRPLDPVDLIPASVDGPGEQAERRETTARAREALQSLKPAELRALTLLAEGYSYAEIGEITGFSKTKVNRLLAEGRERFRSIVSSSQSGGRCRELAQPISAFCDGEANAEEATVVREHLRACAHCRATMRAYRTAPRLAAALVPALPASPSLLMRVRELLPGLGSKVGMVKHVAICAGATAGAAACVATGVLPSPFGLDRDRRDAPAIERVGRPAGASSPKRAKRAPAKRPKQTAKQFRRRDSRTEEPSAETESVDTVEYESPLEAPSPEAVSPPAPPEASAPAGSAAGEFGP